MPLPEPRPSEREPDFIDRCMADPVAIKEYEDPEQRRAVCQGQWDAQPKAENQAGGGGFRTMDRRI